jgi:hypothetical protein
MGNAGLRLALLIAVISVAALPGSAHGAVTIGSDLAPDPVGGPCNTPQPCTAASTAHPGLQVMSPFSGVIVRWRVRNDGVDGAGNPVTMRVINLVGGSGVGISTGDTQTVLDENGLNASTQVFPTRHSIAAGNLVALDIPAPNGNLLIQAIAAQSSLSHWRPPLPNGGTHVAPNEQLMGEYTYNADVEPDADGDGYGDETQDQCPTNAGTQGACPPTPTTTTPSKKKKCKKGQKRKKGKCVKKKRKKRKK